MREEKALVGLHECLGLHKPSLLANPIKRTRISCAGPLVFVARKSTLCVCESEGFGETRRMLKVI